MEYGIILYIVGAFAFIGVGYLSDLHNQRKNDSSTKSKKDNRIQIDKNFLESRTQK